MKIVVYTAIFGEIDPLWSSLPVALGEYSPVCFMERQRAEWGVWGHDVFEERPYMVANNVASPTNFWDRRIVPAPYGGRRTARYYKTLAHKHFSTADVTIWVDGNVRLLRPPEFYVEQYLLDGDLAVFNHPDRHCLYDEAWFCQLKGKERSRIIKSQVEGYRKNGMPLAWGLAETKCVIRRNTPKMKQFNEAWWQEIRTKSVRDQVSLPYICWELGIKWNVIPGRAGLPTFPGEKNPEFWFTRHAK